MVGSRAFKRGFNLATPTLRSNKIAESAGFLGMLSGASWLAGFFIDPIDYVTGIGNAHSNQYKIFAHSALWCWSSSPRSELENSVSWTAEVRLS